jgi:aromatic ring hydroxylase
MTRCTPKRPSRYAHAWHKRAQESVLFMNHAIVNPPIDRDKPADAVKDVFVYITKETDAGINVTGAKVVATSSALTHYNFRDDHRGSVALGDFHCADECAGHQDVLRRVVT